MEKIKSLQKIDFEMPYSAFNEAFKDYEMQWSKPEFKAMLERRGFVPELSFGAFANEKLVAFTLNGIGIFQNKKTAYDTGTGTIKEFRGKGLATKIFEYSLPFLKEAKIEKYLLEVLQHNTKAISVYKNLGFTTEREFNYFVQKVEKIEIPKTPLPPMYSIKETDLKEEKRMEDFFDFQPSWQNSFEAINRKKETFKILGAFKENKLVGYCIFEPQSGDIAQLAVDKEYRRKGIASALFREILKYNRHHSIKIINTQTDCEAMTAFLASANIGVRGKQFEMVREL